MPRILLLSIDPDQCLMGEYQASENAVGNTNSNTKRDKELFEYIASQAKSYPYEKIVICCCSTENQSANIATLNRFHQQLSSYLTGIIAPSKIYFFSRSNLDFTGFANEKTTIPIHYIFLHRFASTEQLPTDLHIISSSHEGKTEAHSANTKLDLLTAYYQHHHRYIPKNCKIITVPYKKGRIKRCTHIEGSGQHHPEYLEHARAMLINSQTTPSTHVIIDQTYDCTPLVRKIKTPHFFAQNWDRLLVGALLPPILIILAFLSMTCAKPSLLFLIKGWVLKEISGGLPVAIVAATISSTLAGLVAGGVFSKLFPRRSKDPTILFPIPSFIQWQKYYLAAGFAIAPIVSALTFLIIRFASPQVFADITNWSLNTFKDVGGIPFGIVAGSVVSSCIGTLIAAIFAKWHHPKMFGPVILRAVIEEDIRPPSKSVSRSGSLSKRDLVASVPIGQRAPNTTPISTPSVSRREAASPDPSLATQSNTSIETARLSRDISFSQDDIRTTARPTHEPRAKSAPARTSQIGSFSNRRERKVRFNDTPTITQEAGNPVEPIVRSSTP